MNEKKTPAIRFQGFTDGWEQSKLGDIFKEYSEKNHEELPALTIVQGKGTITREESSRDLQYDKSSLPNYKMVKKDDFIIHLRSFEGGLEKASSDGIISPAYHTLHGDNTDSRFYYPFFRSKKFIDYLLKPHVYGIRDGKSIDIEGMKTIDIPVPILAEQQKIGSYLEQIDNFISLHRCKLTKLQLLKKSMLTKMFPKDGACVPEIRFQGFHDDWEQRKLGNVIEDYVEKTTVEDQYPVLTSSQQKGIVLQDEYFSGERVTQNGNIGYFVIPCGYFAYRSRSDNDVFAFNRNDAIDMGIISYFYPVFKPMGVDSEFLLRRLNYGLEEQIKINSEGTGQHVLSLKKFKNIVGLFPSYKEQKLIGRYFKELDRLIILQQCKISKLQQIKQAMLSKLFV